MLINHLGIFIVDAAAVDVVNIAAVARADYLFILLMLA
jgi:hypothetical protein